MDLQTAFTLAMAGTAGIAGATYLVYRAAANSPEGYEDEQGFHLGTPPAPPLPVIDWSKPLELLDGTPVKLDPTGLGGKNPDRDGDWWIVREDGERITATDGGRYRSMCVHPNGCEEQTDTVVVRNRAALDWSRPLEFVAGNRDQVLPATLLKSDFPGNMPYDVRAADGFTWAVSEDGEIIGTAHRIRNRVEAPAAANENVPQLTDDQRNVLLAMSEEIGWTARALAGFTGLPHKRVTTVRRELADKGLAILTELRGDCGESHELAGRGYILTPEGVALRDNLAKQVAA